MEPRALTPTLRAAQRVLFALTAVTLLLLTAYVCVRDAAGAVLARMESRHVHGVGVDSRGDIYAGLTVDRSVDKFVRTG